MVDTVPPEQQFSKFPGARCWECPFKDVAPVPTWNRKPKSCIIVLGEAPGAHEAAKGIPFTGPSGELLNQVLNHHGIHREDVMITNACLCRPEGNADPPKKALEACSARLHKEIIDSGADTIIAVGKIAAHSVLEERGSMKRMRVGPPKPYRVDPNIRVVPTWHPAYSLRSPDSFPDLVFDIGKLKDGKVDAWLEPDYRVFDDPDLAIRALEIIRTGYDRVVIDIECGVEKDNAFVHPSEYDLLCVGIAFAQGRAVVIGENALQDTRVRHALRRLLRETRIIAHNGKFDLAGLRAICGKQELWFDTMLAAYCVAPDTRCLGADLIWREAKDLKPGDELIGFNEHYTSEVMTAKVLATKKQLAHTFKIKTGRGEVIASANHRWPVRQRDGEHTKIYWKTTKELYDEHKKRGWRLLHFVEPWEVDRSFEAGYLAGFLDGEGNFAGGSINKKSGSERIQFTQNVGPVLDNVLALLREKGFNPKLDSRVARTAEQWELSNRESMRLLGSVRPNRFISKANKLWEGTRRCTPVDIYEIEYLDIQEVYGITTSTGTLIAEGFFTHNSLDERPGHMGLKALSIERLGAPDYEQDIKGYIPRGGNYANIPRDILYRYNAYDVVCTWALYELFSTEMSDADRRKHDFIIQAANTLIELELAGIGFDLDYNEKLAHEYLTKIADIETQIHDLVGFELNPRSPIQITKYYAAKGYVLETTNADLLKELLDHLSGEVQEFTRLLLNHRKEAKLYGTYVKGLAKRVSHGKIYTTYLLHGTTSGRLASREPNLQNVVRNKPIRNQFVVQSEDYCFIQLDYKQAEGRVITTLARDEYLRGIFADASRDLFNELCDQIFGVGNWAKENRVAMKSIFYGNAYGRGVASITRELNLQGNPITLEGAATLMREFNGLIPDVMKWQAMIKHKVLSGEDLTTPYGRKRSFWLITDKNKADVLNEALSFLPQSIASDICLTALIRLQPMLEGLAVPRLTVHDALIVETHVDNVDEVIQLMRTEMMKSASEFTDYVPFEVDATVGLRLGEL